MSSEGRASCADTVLCFERFRLHCADEQLWRGEQRIALKPKALSVLRYLLEHGGRLITKRELLHVLWEGVHVCEAVLKAHLRDIRWALSDDAKEPRFIETVRRHGYRFIAPVSREEGATGARAHGGECVAQSRFASADHFVGREAELSRLEACLGLSLRGHMQTLFLRGGAGAGKTALAAVFSQRLEQRGGLRLVRAHCSDASNTGAAQPEQTLREMAHTLDALGEQQPPVLIVEDLQWAAPSTLRLLQYLVRRGRSARMLLVCTYRPKDMLEAPRCLSDAFFDLASSARGRELGLCALDSWALVDYLALRFPGHRFPRWLASVLGEMTGGNPLGVCRLVDAWQQSGCLRREAGTWGVSVEVAELTGSSHPGVTRQPLRASARLRSFEGEILSGPEPRSRRLSASPYAAIDGP